MIAEHSWTFRCHHTVRMSAPSQLFPLGASESLTLSSHCRPWILEGPARQERFNFQALRKRNSRQLIGVFSTKGKNSCRNMVLAFTQLSSSTPFFAFLQLMFELYCDH
jgi:hypothetical protein